MCVCVIVCLCVCDCVFLCVSIKCSCFLYFGLHTLGCPTLVRSDCGTENVLLNGFMMTSIGEPVL